ncbi:hypothetical protein [Streptomyces monashensis]|nr:hypothetical protein [Streptomyces monashensis]
MLPYSVTDVNRHFPMGQPAGVFAPAVMVVGRLRGIMTLVCHGLSARI